MQQTTIEKDRVILHIDMNNFYASVECLLNPELKDKPIAVCGSEQNRHGIVLAKNGKAKATGILTGETIRQAKRKCPDLIVVPPNHKTYSFYSKLAHKIYEEYTDQIEPFGIDECWLDVTGSYHFGTGFEIADKIRRQVKSELGLTVSAGVSFNKIFAKLASDLKKPDAITQISRESFKEQIWDLPASCLLGIGKKTAKLLASYGITTIGRLAAVPDSFIQSLLGKNGLKLKTFANGEDNSPVASIKYTTPPKSLGAGMTLPEDLEKSQEVWPIMLELAQEVSDKLKLHKKKASGMAISIKDKDFGVKEWQNQSILPLQFPREVAEFAFSIFEKNYLWKLPVRSVTLRAINLVSEGSPIQRDLFSNREEAEKLDRLSCVVESIRAKFGNDAIKRAILFQDDIKMPKGERSPGFPKIQPSSNKSSD